MFSYTTMIGIFVGFGLFAFAVFQATNNWIIFVSLSSMSMVFGGTMGATLIAYQGIYVWRTLKTIPKIFVPSASASTLFKDTEQLIGWSNEVKKKGLGYLDSIIETENFSDEFMKYALSLTTTYKGAKLEDLLTEFIDNQFVRDNVQVNILKTMGNFAPAFGMIGTLVGLVAMLDNLDDPSQLGIGLSLALITTLYGVLVANMIFKPAALKIEQKNEIAKFRYTLLANGFVRMSNKESAIELQDGMNCFLAPTIHIDIFKTNS